MDDLAFLPAHVLADQIRSRARSAEEGCGQGKSSVAGTRRDAPDREDLGVSRADVAASFQRAVGDVLAARSLEAAAREGARDLVIGGGVAANRELRRILAERAPAGLRVRFPAPSLCVDNGAMVALRGAQLLARGRQDDLGLDVSPTGRA